MGPKRVPKWSYSGTHPIFDPFETPFMTHFWTPLYVHIVKIIGFSGPTVFSDPGMMDSGVPKMVQN